MFEFLGVYLNHTICEHVRVLQYYNGAQTNSGWSKTASTKGHITVWGKITGRKERNSTAIKRLVCCSNRPKFCCTPNASFDFRAIF